MHTEPLPEPLAGEPCSRPCPQCGKAGRVVVRIWTSANGAYEDEQYSCAACGYYWWVDGADA